MELQDLFEDDKYVHIVMERCTGGDLFDRVVSEIPRQLSSLAKAVKYETRTAHVMCSILHVLKYLHSKFIVHRDITPEHFLLTIDVSVIFDKLARLMYLTNTLLLPDR